MLKGRGAEERGSSNDNESAVAVIHVFAQSPKKIGIEKSSVHRTDCGTEHSADTQGRVTLNVWSTQCQGHRQRQYRTVHRGHVPIPMKEFKI